jgi:hypothetical protein
MKTLDLPKRRSFELLKRAIEGFFVQCWATKPTLQKAT